MKSLKIVFIFREEEKYFLTDDPDYRDGAAFFIRIGVNILIFVFFVIFRV